jgi:hypothetical protein
MAERDFDAVFYVKKAPVIRFENGMFTICYIVGRAQFEFAMQPSVWRHTRREADRADKEFEDAKRPITQIRRRKVEVAH